MAFAKAADNWTESAWASVRGPAPLSLDGLWEQDLVQLYAKKSGTRLRVETAAARRGTGVARSFFGGNLDVSLASMLTRRR